MEKMPSFNVKAHFHVSYLKEILKEHNLSYTKSNPKAVSDEPYFVELNKRVDETTHIASFRNLIELLRDIKSEMEN